VATGFAVSRRQPGASREVWHAGVPHWVAAVPKWAGEVVHLRVDGADAQVPEASRWSFVERDIADVAVGRPTSGSGDLADDFRPLRG
jgi:hypothetical protein